MGKITAEVSNEVGIKLPEACPLHKHEISFYGSGSSIINQDYYKHRVGTDDEYTDGQQYHDCGDFTVPDGRKISTITNGTRSGGDNNSRTGTVHVISNKINTFDGNNKVEVRINLEDIVWIEKGTAFYTREAAAAEGGGYFVSWDTTSAVYRNVYKPYYEDRDYPSDINKIDSSGQSSYGEWQTYNFPKNESEDSYKFRYCPGDYDYVIQRQKPVEYTVNAETRSGIKGSTEYAYYYKTDYESVTVNNASITEYTSRWEVSWKVQKGIEITITATHKSE